MMRIVAVVAMMAVLLGGFFGLARFFYGRPGPLTENRIVIIPKVPLDQVADVLAHEGVVGNPTALRLAALITRGQGPIHAAEFNFPRGASLADVLAILRFGKPVLHKLTIPEGMTAKQLIALLEKTNTLDGPTPPIEEGSILPETYTFERGTPRATVIERGKRAMDRALDQAWNARTGDLTPLTTPRDALILASIVERETKLPDERARIAGVFLNRLRRGMKLQSDPTVVYAASNGLGVLDHGLTRAELDLDDAYNTYKIQGLPPGPIAMPGLASIKAVTRPWPTDEIYFVADGSGGHVFAKTEADHLRNVAKWRDIERQRATRPAPAPASAPAAN